MKLLFARMKAFARDNRGSVSLETMIILPAVIWAWMAMFTIFDAYRQITLTQKANYTVADLISRQAEIDSQFLDGMELLFTEMTRSPAHTALRVTSVTYDADKDEYSVLWSQARGNQTQLTTEIIKNWHENLPILADESTVVVVETWSTFTPASKIGLPSQDIGQFTFTRPRYTPCVIWRDSGDGDCLSS